MTTISPLEYAARRSRLLSLVQTNSIIIVPAAQEQTRSNDTEYHFRQNSDFFYLTGFSEPDAFLVLTNKANIDDTHAVQSIIFVRPSDPKAEIWHGRRMGVNKAPTELHIDLAHNIDELSDILPELINGHSYLYYSLSQNAKADEHVQLAMQHCKNAPKQSKVAPQSIVDVNKLIHAMRLIKSPSEIACMQHSANISCAAHIAAMKICKPNMHEYQLEATILHSFAMQGARHAAYNTIVGGGENACILHYTENANLLNNNELVLIDAGSEFAGYAADITRTFPINGRFTPAQKEIYQLVLNTQLACIKLLKPGKTIAEAMQVAVQMITQGLIDLGIIKGELEPAIESEAHKAFFMHGLGHYLGLDVHDVGDYKTVDATSNIKHDKPLEIGMVLTVEPGIYISAASAAPEQYKSIGVRIEDNIVITETGNRVLTLAAPKEIAEIETLMQI